MQGQGRNGVDRGYQNLKSAALAHIAESVRQRAGTDELIKRFYLYIPIAAVTFGLLTFAIMLYIAGPVTGLVLGWLFMYFVGFAILAVLNYRLVKRLNAHTRREAVLRTGIIEYVRATAEAQGKSSEVANETSTMESIDRDALSHERESSILVTPFAAVPLVGFLAEYYALRAVTRPSAIHDRRWHALMQQVQSAGSRLGFQVMLPPSKGIPNRSFAAFTILSLVFFPFMAYWYIVLIKDMNRHFELQWKVEDSLLSTLD